MGYLLDGRNHEQPHNIEQMTYLLFMRNYVNEIHEAVLA